MCTCSKDIEEPHDYELSKKEDTFASTATTTVTSTVTSTAASTAANSDDEMSNDKPGYFHINCSRPVVKRWVFVIRNPPPPSCLAGTTRHSNCIGTNQKILTLFASSFVTNFSFYCLPQNLETNNGQYNFF